MVVNPEEDIKAISAVSVVVILFGMHVECRSTVQPNHSTITRRNEARKPVFLITERR
jgi:hypothetical protein